MMRPRPFSLAKVLKPRMERIVEAILNRLTLIGEECIRLARENGEYRDITGNLRSSIGYLILRDGVVVSANFAESERGSDKSTGRSQGEALANELAARHPTGFVLIVVAGMGYAAKVESRGKDVLTGTSIECERLLKEAMQILKGKVAA